MKKKTAVVLIVLSVIVVFGVVFSIIIINSNKESSTLLTTKKEYITNKPTESRIEQTTSGKQSLTIGDKTYFGGFELTIKSVEFTNTVLPWDRSGYYRYYEAADGNVFVCVKVEVKNLGKDYIMSSSVAQVEVDYNDGYKYTGFSVVDDETLGFTNGMLTSVAPLETQEIIYIIECPEEVEKTNYPIYVILKNAKQEFVYNMR